jgi:hypothetical protein
MTELVLAGTLQGWMNELARDALTGTAHVRQEKVTEKDREKQLWMWGES